MMKLHRVLFAVCLIGFTFLNSSAQKRSSAQTKPNPPASSLSQELEKQIKENALAAVGAEIDRAKRFNQIKDRIIVWTTAADVMWEIDANKSKELLRDSYEIVEQATVEPREGEKQYLLAVRNTSLQRRLRGEILAVAQKRDPNFLKELVKSIREDPQEMKSTHNQPAVFGSASFEKQALASLASQLAPTDPAKAVRYALDSLGYGVPQEFGDIFKKLILTNPFYAKQLFAQSVNVYSLDNSLNLYDGLILSSYLRFLPVPETDVGLVQRFLDVSLRKSQAVLQKNMSDEVKDAMSLSALTTVNNAMSVYYKAYWIEKLPELNALLAQASNKEAIKPETDSLLNSDEKASGIDALIEKAEKARTDEEADALYFEAGLLLADQKNFARSLDVIGRAKNADKKEVVQTYVFRRQAEDLIKKAELFEASKVIKKIKDPEYIAELALMFAKAVNKQDKWLGISILEDAKNYFEANASAPEHSRAYLWLASAFANFEDARAFELMYSAVKSANKSRELDDVRSETKFVNLGGNSNRVVLTGGVQGDFRIGFARLARKDFNQAISIAQSFENQLFRSLAVIASAEAILVKPVKS